MKVTCPRCGAPGYLEEMCVKSTTGEELCYYRVVHYYKENGKRRKKVHYFGPTNGEYRYVEKVHELGLTNLMHQDPTTIVYNAVSRLIDEARSVRGNKKHVVLGKVRKLKGLMKQLIQELESIEKDLTSTTDASRQIKPEPTNEAYETVIKHETQ
jgi:hypothetical protein